MCVPRCLDLDRTHSVPTSYMAVPNHIGGKNGLHLRPPPSRDSIPTLRITTHLGHHPSHGRLGQQTTMPFWPLYAAPDCPPWASGPFHWKPTHAPIRKLVSKFASISSRLLDPDGSQQAIKGSQRMPEDAVDNHRLIKMNQHRRRPGRRRHRRALGHAAPLEPVPITAVAFPACQELRTTTYVRARNPFPFPSLPLAEAPVRGGPWR